MQMAVVADYYKDFMILPVPLRFVIKIVAALTKPWKERKLTRIF